MVFFLPLLSDLICLDWPNASWSTVILDSGHIIYSCKLEKRAYLLEVCRRNTLACPIQPSCYLRSRYVPNQELLDFCTCLNYKITSTRWFISNIFVDEEKGNKLTVWKDSEIQNNYLWGKSDLLTPCVECLCNFACQYVYWVFLISLHILYIWSTFDTLSC